MQVVVLLTCLTLCTARSTGDVGSEAGIGLRLPFLGKITLDLGTGLGFNEGLFGLGKMMIGKRVGSMVLRNVNGRNAAGGKSGNGEVKNSDALVGVFLKF
ncbi:unnamed protein product [Parnassius apollo]|uniref:(apollo) hypothetical protein n=1 Tax=Parnassius apollo TaxID=110799 RepID=A0A8S3X2G0_PARAO|nr:unnamed protein product [Parnassius apollo]